MPMTVTFRFQTYDWVRCLVTGERGVVIYGMACDDGPHNSYRVLFGPFGRYEFRLCSEALLEPAQPKDWSKERDLDNPLHDKNHDPRMVV